MLYCRLMKMVQQLADSNKKYKLALLYLTTRPVGFNGCQQLHKIRTEEILISRLWQTIRDGTNILKSDLHPHHSKQVHPLLEKLQHSHDHN